MQSFFTHEKFRLIQFSFLLLFVELVLIRWMGSNVLYLSFFANFVLMASFLGIGIGMIRAPSKRPLFPFALVTLAIMVWLGYYFASEYQAVLDPARNDLNFDFALFKHNLIPTAISLPILFVCVMLVMAMMADGLKHSFQAFTPLIAYRLDILGALCAIILFTLLAFYQTTPLSWGIVISVVFISLSIPAWRSKKWLIPLHLLAVVALLVTLQQKSDRAIYHWSPYYKISLVPYADKRIAVNVNGIPQQFIESVAQRKIYKPFYFLPYQHMQPEHQLEHVLVIGAGTGGDVAIALAQGAKQIDAVEIDPWLYQLGKQYNPDHPYRDPRVHVFIDDGRAFLQRHHTHYDMITFALPDSLKALATHSSLRLEDYLFTAEGIAAMQSHLTPQGIFTMYNYYGDRWMIDRLANTLKQVFHHAPCFDTGGPANHWLSVLTISPDQQALHCQRTWQPLQAYPVATPTDDYPFLYLQYPHIPGLYVFFLIFVSVVAIVSYRAIGGKFSMLFKHGDLFLLGAAFLLLETKNIASFALLFGTTWLVNAYVFIGILTSVYLSIEVAARYTNCRINILYGALMLALICAFLIPQQALLTLPFAVRFLLATLLAFMPIFLANLIFATRFRDIEHATEAFGANLLGAMLGGMLEYLSLLMGNQHLLLLAAGLYTLAILLFICNKKRFPPSVISA